MLYRLVYRYYMEPQKCWKPKTCAPLPMATVDVLPFSPKPLSISLSIVVFKRYRFLRRSYTFPPVFPGWMWSICQMCVKTGRILGLLSLPSLCSEGPQNPTKSYQVCTRVSLPINTKVSMNSTSSAFLPPSGWFRSSGALTRSNNKVGMRRISQRSFCHPLSCSPSRSMLGKIFRTHPVRGKHGCCTFEEKLKKTTEVSSCCSLTRKLHVRLRVKMQQRTRFVGRIILQVMVMVRAGGGVWNSWTSAFLGDPYYGPPQ